MLIFSWATQRLYFQNMMGLVDEQSLGGIKAKADGHKIENRINDPVLE